MNQYEKRRREIRRRKRFDDAMKAHEVTMMKIFPVILVAAIAFMVFIFCIMRSKHLI